MRGCSSMYFVRCRGTQSLSCTTFVIMPDHLHLLLTVYNEMTIEKAMQLIKGRFSHRLSHEFGYKGEVWQRGFAEVQVMNRENFETHREYIAQNPVKAGLAASADEFPFCFRYLAEEGKRKRRLAGAKARKHFSVAFAARLKPCPVTKLEIEHRVRTLTR